MTEALQWSMSNSRSLRLLSPDLPLSRLFWLLSFLKQEHKNCKTGPFFIIIYISQDFIHKVSITVACLSQSGGNLEPVKGNHAITHKWGLTWCGHIPVLLLAVLRHLCTHHKICFRYKTLVWGFHRLLTMISKACTKYLHLNNVNCTHWKLVNVKQVQEFLFELNLLLNRPAGTHDYCTPSPWGWRYHCNWQGLSI